MYDLRRPAHVCKLKSAELACVSSYSLHTFHNKPRKTVVSQSETELETPLFRKVNRLIDTNGKERKTRLYSTARYKGQKDEREDSSLVSYLD